MRCVGVCLSLRGSGTLVVLEPPLCLSNVVIQCALQCSIPVGVILGGLHVGMRREIYFMSVECNELDRKCAPYGMQLLGGVSGGESIYSVR